GFYLKLGQILAAKTDMLPAPYTESLSRLLDRLPPAPYGSICRTIRAELGDRPERLFRELDPFPLASATIAQVHRGALPDGRAVVVKVQHGSAARMMRGDLANLAALSGLMGAAGLQLGFDHGSLIREYNVQPRPCSKRGHPGNVLAMRRRTVTGPRPPHTSAAAAAAASTSVAPWPLAHGPHTPDADELQVALLDFGQAKELSPASRARYALLVAAMAVSMGRG
ncbi:hypothetical protein TSOC_007514, partial [Tetrabaena socialis]